jgi:outer membrane protein assembly factor BamD (BamD/ComL family)
VRLSPPAPAQPEAEPSLSRRALGPAHARPGVTQSKSPRLRSRRGLEGTLLKLAEQQLRRGDSFGAQLRLAELARRVPRGALMQERKWTEIHVLLAVGDESSARRAAGEFAKAYPHSARLPELATLLLGP